MKDLDKNELMEVDGGNANYIAGLGPAIPEPGGAYSCGFIFGFIRQFFGFN